MTSSRHIRAFTMVEIMLVVAIMGLVLTMGIPAIFGALHRPPMAQATMDICQGCRDARARAILQGRPAELRIYPQSRHLEVASAINFNASDPASRDTNSETATNVPAAVFSAQLSDHLIIEMLRVNFVEYKDAEAAHILFFPNGTSDEFTMVVHSDKGEWRKITIEAVTGLPDFGPVQ